MRVLRHRVPHAALLELREADLQLVAAAARLLREHLLNDELVDAARVRLLERARLDEVADRVARLRALLVGRDALRHVLLVRRRRVEVKLRRILRIQRLERHLLLAAADVERLLERELVVLAVHRHDTRAADVDDAEFAAVEEVVGLELEERVEVERLGDGHRAAVDETVVHRVRHVDLVRNHDLLHHEAVADLRRVIRLEVVRMNGSLDLVVDFGRTAGHRRQRETKHEFLHFSISFLKVRTQSFHCSAVVISPAFDQAQPA